MKIKAIGMLVKSKLRMIKKWLPLPARNGSELAYLGLGLQWFELVNLINRRLLFHPNDAILRGKRPGNEDILDYSWKSAFNALGAEQAHRQFDNISDLKALQAFFDRNLDHNGQWLTPINRVDHAMKGYTLLYLCDLLCIRYYKQAVHKLANYLLISHPRAWDGSLIYDINTASVLVDTLGMVGPFLARYAKRFDNPAALELSVTQFRQFIACNVDRETNLPYHGYYAGGPHHLGLHAWGRGTGWYMLGLVDTLAEMPAEHRDFSIMHNAFVFAATSLKQYQLANGHWNWAVLHHDGPIDSSTTSMVGYSLLRGVQLGLLDESFRDVVDKVAQALVNVTCVNGVLDYSLCECRGLGKYPQNYKPTLWVQGATTAFAALYLTEFC